MQSVTRSLRSIWIITKQEFSLYFVSPIVYLIGAVWLFLAGIFFTLSLVAINQGQGELSLVGVFQTMGFLMMFVAPALTMRLVADEVRAGTHELLFTAPIRDWEVIFAKWLAVWAVFSVFILATAPMALLFILRGNPDTGLIVTSYLGLWLLAGGMFAVGVFASSLTQYQAVSFMITMGVLIFLWISTAATQIFTNQTIRDVLTEMSVVTHFNNLTIRALIDPLDLGYFVALIAIFLFLATQMLSARRWSA